MQAHVHEEIALMKEQILFRNMKRHASPHNNLDRVAQHKTWSNTGTQTSCVWKAYCSQKNIYYFIVNAQSSFDLLVSKACSTTSLKSRSAKLDTLS